MALKKKSKEVKADALLEEASVEASSKSSRRRGKGGPAEESTFAAGTEEKAQKKKGLTLRRSKEASSEEETPVELGHPKVPATSFNMMTVRYAIEQRRSLTVIALVGLIAIASVLLMARWLSLSSTETDLRQDIHAAEQEMAALNQTITDLADTGGLNPSEIERLRRGRLEALSTALSGEINYEKLISDILSFDSNRAWVTSIDFSPSDSGVTLRVSGRAVDRVDVDNWFTTINNSLGYGTIEETWPTSSGSPGDASGGLSWSFTILTDNTSYLDRSEEIGIPLPGSRSPSSGEDETTTSTTIPEGGEGE